mmetsp:Transcript_3114/g.9513  ORF Transcript_3114/g.9513 Transcript_3114/m.9513 type:complete len:592 (+) Transcript_3114:298-2073(+)
MPKTMMGAVFTPKTNTDDGRAELLREAATMGLLYHKNLVKIIGVMTIPRTMPMMAHEFCSGGMLVDALANNKTFDQAALLQFCHDVACGMQYLASRRVVHRDLQARKVVLAKHGKKLTAKVTGYGVSTALLAGSSSSEYQKLYKALHGGLPIRYCAPEVLQGGTYSQASDVWAFGVIVHEILSRGTPPYGAIKNDAIVGDQVINGLRLSCPDGFSAVAFESAVLPCFDSEPHARPRFSELTEWIEMVRQCPPGTDPNRSHFVRRIHREDHRDKMGVHAVKADIVAEKAPPAISIYHIYKKLLPQVVAAVQPPWKDSHGHAPAPPEDASIAQAVEAYIRPFTSKTRCADDGKPGTAYIAAVSEKDDIAPADALLSYTWIVSLSSVASALKRWAKQTNRKAKSTHVWMSALNLNLHRSQVKSTPEELDLEMSGRIEAIGHVLPMIEPWRDSASLKNLWCLVELSTAIAQGYEIDIVMSEAEYARVQHTVMTDGQSSLAKALTQVHAENATASREGDVNALRAVIVAKLGGFEVLNREVKKNLVQWFQKQGVGHGAARLSLAPMRSDSSDIGFDRPGNFENLDLAAKAAVAALP